MTVKSKDYLQLTPPTIYLQSIVEMKTNIKTQSADTGRTAVFTLFIGLIYVEMFWLTCVQKCSYDSKVKHTKIVLTNLFDMSTKIIVNV